MDDDRAVYYDALGRVRAVDHRTANGSAGLSQMVFTFEEFRYDALGRRVLGRTRRFCRRIESVDCVAETIRRTVWDGAQELAEIQMPGGDTVSAATLENDTEPVASRRGTFDEALNAYKHANPFFGRVVYTHAIGIDRPLSVVRFDFADSIPGRPFFRWAPFSLVPHWNLRGEADNGSFADGALTKCMSDGVGQRCVQVRWPFGWTATAQQAYVRDLWHGSLLESKRDGSGLLFRRSRYVDPATGRFTQEDPIGLAGGLNLYAFVGGDPVNFSDPFGLWPIDWGKLVTGVMTLVGNYFGHLEVGESKALIEVGNAEVLRTEAERAAEYAEGDKSIRKPVAAGGKPPVPLPRGASAASVARAAGGKLLPAAGLGVSILTSYKHGENESLPEMVCRIEKCDPTIKVVPDPPQKPKR